MTWGALVVYFKFVDNNTLGLVIKAWFGICPKIGYLPNINKKWLINTKSAK